MKIIIVGCGKVGYAIAQQLTQEKHDITVVDDEAAHLNRADSTLDVLCIHGNGASSEPCTVVKRCSGLFECIVGSVVCHIYVVSFGSTFQK